MIRLELHGVSKQFDDGVPVLSGVSFCAQPGEIVVLRGPNGCGKTTLLNMIANIMQPTSGSITADNITYPESRVAYVFQNYTETLLPWLSVAENITLPLRLEGVARVKRDEILERTLDELGFADLPLRRSPTTLSGGQQLKASIARAIITNSQLMLFDEPFSSLDRHSKRQVEELIGRLRDSCAHIVFVVVHDLDDAIFIADRVICLEHSPMTVVGEVRIRLPWPRSPDLRTAPEFLEARETILRKVGAI